LKSTLISKIPFGLNYSRLSIGEILLVYPTQITLIIHV
jgi:hypothetical protein